MLFLKEPSFLKTTVRGETVSEEHHVIAAAVAYYATFVYLPNSLTPRSPLRSDFQSFLHRSWNHVKESIYFAIQREKGTSVPRSAWDTVAGDLGAGGKAAVLPITDATLAVLEIILSVETYDQQDRLVSLVSSVWVAQNPGFYKSAYSAAVRKLQEEEFEMTIPLFLAGLAGKAWHNQENPHFASDPYIILLKVFMRSLLLACLESGSLSTDEFNRAFAN